MRISSSFLASTLSALLVASSVGCGGQTETLDFGSPDDGSEGADAGADAREDAAEPDAAPDDGGSSDADSGSDSSPPKICPPPVDPSKAALCLKIEPEEIGFIASDEALDGEGILFIEIFDKARPTATDSPLRRYVAPEQPQAGTLTGSITELTSSVFRFEDLPPTVYPRAVFIDDVANATPDALLPGTWIGGIDFSNGFIDDPPLQKMELVVGEGTSRELDLMALRKLMVTVTRSATPAAGGDAQGPLTVAALGAQEISEDAKVFGFGEKGCADLSASKTALVEGVVVGKGPYWVTGVLDDFGVGGAVPAGGLTSASMAGIQFKVPDQNQLVYPADAYAISLSIDLNQPILLGSPGADSVSCP